MIIGIPNSFTRFCTDSTSTVTQHYLFTYKDKGIFILLSFYEYGGLTRHDDDIFARTLDVCASSFTLPVVNLSATSLVTIIHPFQVHTIPFLFAVQFWILAFPTATVDICDIPTFATLTSKSLVQLGTLMIFLAILLL